MRRFLTFLIISTLAFSLPAKGWAYALCDGNTAQHEKQVNETHCGEKSSDSSSNVHTCTDCPVCIAYVDLKADPVIKDFCLSTLNFLEFSTLLYDLIYFSEKPPKRA